MSGQRLDNLKKLVEHYKHSVDKYKRIAKQQQALRSNRGLGKVYTG